MPYDPSQPRDEDGQWTDAGGSTSRKLDISDAAVKLRRKGWELGEGHYDFNTKQTSYEVRHPRTGQVLRKTADEIKRFIP
jgi:hypothetical protein